MLWFGVRRPHPFPHPGLFPLLGIGEQSSYTILRYNNPVDDDDCDITLETVYFWDFCFRISQRAAEEAVKLIFGVTPNWLLEKSPTSAAG